MKFFLTVLILSASFLSLTNGDPNCAAKCTMPQPPSDPPSRFCSAMQAFMTCIKPCDANWSDSQKKLAQEMMKNSNLNCDLSGSSTVSGSLLTVTGALLFTAYRAFNL